MQKNQCCSLSKRNTVQMVRNATFTAFLQHFYSINSILNQEFFENLVWSDKSSIPDAHPIGCFHLLFFFDSLKPPTMHDYQITWGSYKKCVHTWRHWITKILINRECLDWGTWNFRVRRRIWCSFRPYPVQTSLVSYDGSQY